MFFPKSSGSFQQNPRLPDVPFATPWCLLVNQLGLTHQELCPQIFSPQRLAVPHEIFLQKTLSNLLLNQISPPLHFQISMLPTNLLDSLKSQPSCESWLDSSF